jgi:Flp pilus assembly protein TadG
MRYLVLRHLATAGVRLRHDEQGAMAIIMALCIVPVLALIGLSVDAGRAYVAQSRLSYALDSAALAGGRAYVEAYAKGATARSDAVTSVVDAYFSANYPTNYLGAPKVVKASIVSDDGTTLVVKVDTTIPTSFLHLVGIKDFTIAKQATIRRDISAQEIVMVLDNTGSMYENCTGSAASCSTVRFERMRNAAKDMVNTMFDNEPKAGFLRMGIVPFVTTVNIRAEQPLNEDNSKSAAANYGLPPAAEVGSKLSYLITDNATKTPHTSTSLDALYAPASWRGCIEAQTSEGFVSGGKRVDAVSDAAPPGGMKWVPFRYPSTFGSTFPPGNPTPNNQRTFNGTTLPRCAGIGDNDFLGAAELGAMGLSCYTDDATPLIQTLKPTDYCLLDPWEPGWNKLNTDQCPAAMKVSKLAYFYGETPDMRGPNMSCPVPMLGLTGNRNQLLRKLDEMNPRGRSGTANDVGMIWGLRMLSPRTEWKQFFGTESKSYPVNWFDGTSQKSTQKIAILLTDGGNQGFDFKPNLTRADLGKVVGGVPNATGGKPMSDYTYYGRLDGTRIKNTSELDVLMLSVCQTMQKAPYNVTVYAILVDVSDTKIQDTYRKCASGSDKFFNIKGNELSATFSKISAQLTNLRLTQ